MKIGYEILLMPTSIYFEMSSTSVLQSGSGGVGLTRYVQVVVLRGAGSNPACRNSFCDCLMYMLCDMELIFLL
jgi:hypothetical protein